MDQDTLRKRNKRLKIYEKALWCVSELNYEFYCVCWLLWDMGLYDYPEFDQQRPKNKKGWDIWWTNTESGNRKRRLALERAIELCKKQTP